MFDKCKDGNIDTDQNRGFYFLHLNMNVGQLNLIDGTTYQFTQPKPNFGQLGLTK